MRPILVLPLLLALCLMVPVLSTTAMAADTHFTLTGTVTDDQGLPLPDARVYVVNVTSEEAYSFGVDEDGNYSISIPAGIYNISASANGYEANTIYEFLQLDGNVTGIDFTMLPLLGGLTGFVTNGTVPVVGATIYLTNQDHNYSALSFLPFGQFNIDDVEPGVYVTYAEKVGYRLSINATPILIKKGSMSVVNFSLEEQPATLFGKVLSNGEAVEGALVTIGEGDARLQTTSDQGGNYTLTDLVAGTYTVTVEKEGYVKNSITVNIKPFEERRMDLSVDQEAEEADTYLAGFDLPHSLMIAGLALALVILSVAIVIRFRVIRDPGLLAEEEEE